MLSPTPSPPDVSGGAGRRCGVLGDPIAHSLSPVLHRAAYAELGLDWTYDAHRVASGGLRDVPRRTRRGVARAVADHAAQARGAAAGRPAHRPGAPGRCRQHARARGRRHPGRRQHRPARGGRRHPRAHVDPAGDGDDPRAAVRRPPRSGSRWPTSACARSPWRCGTRPGRPRRSPPSGRTRLRPRSWCRRWAPDPPAPTSWCRPSRRRRRRPSWSRAVRTCRSSSTCSTTRGPRPSSPRLRDRAVVGGLDLLVHQAVLQVELFTGRTVAVDVLREAGERALAARHAG